MFNNTRGYSQLRAGFVIRHSIPCFFQHNTITIDCKRKMRLIPTIFLLSSLRCHMAFSAKQYIIAFYWPTNVPIFEQLEKFSSFKVKKFSVNSVMSFQVYVIKLWFLDSRGLSATIGWKMPPNAFETVWPILHLTVELTDYTVFPCMCQVMKSGTLTVASSTESIDSAYVSRRDSPFFKHASPSRDHLTAGHF